MCNGCGIVCSEGPAPSTVRRGRIACSVLPGPVLRARARARVHVRVLPVMNSARTAPGPADWGSMFGAARHPPPPPLRRSLSCSEPGTVWGLRWHNLSREGMGELGGQGDGGHKGCETPMGAASCGGRGVRQRARGSGERAIGAAGCRQHSTSGGMPPSTPGLCLIGGGVQGVTGAVTMAVAGEPQSGWGQLLAVGGAVAGGWGAGKGMRQGVV